MTKHKFRLVSAMVAASLVLPFVIEHRAQIRLNAKEESLRQQTDRIAQLTAGNNRLSNLVARVKPPLSDAQLAELLRLRNEVGQLRAQTNAIQKLRETNRQLEDRFTGGQIHENQMSSAEFDEKFAAETIQTMKRIYLELPAASQKFALDHTNQPPTEFSQLIDYFNPSGGHKIFGLPGFGFARDGGPLPGDALILSESGARNKPDGRFARVYAFSDGQVVEVTLDDRDDFQAWEKEHMGALPSPNP